MINFIKLFILIGLIKNGSLFEYNPLVEFLNYTVLRIDNSYSYENFNIYGNNNEEDIQLNLSGWSSPENENIVYFKNCNLSSFPINYFEAFPYIVNMTITNCRLQKISNQHFRPLQPNLLLLVNLTENYLKTLQPGIFSSVNNLEVLDISKNLISEIVSETFNGLTNLQILNLNHNKIVKIDENGFTPLRNLTELNLSGNLIKELGTKHFINQINLQFLYLQRNKIVEFRNVHNDVFKSFQRLRHFDISENPQILHFPLKINLHLFELNELESLNMARTFFQTFNVNTFSKMTALQSLDLSDNNYEKFDIEILNPIKDLKRLYLDGNNLVEIDYENQKIIKNNFIFKINNNNWNCSYLYEMENHFYNMHVNYQPRGNRLRWNRTINGIGCQSKPTNLIETIDNSNKSSEFLKMTIDIIIICIIIFIGIGIILFFWKKYKNDSHEVSYNVEEHLVAIIS